MTLRHPTRLRNRLAQSLMFVVMATALAVVPAQISVASAGVVADAVADAGAVHAGMCTSNGVVTTSNGVDCDVTFWV